MRDDLEAGTANRERLSALVDGELDGSALALACARWRDDAESRAAWHAYQLIGDVLRSDDLAADPSRDAGFIEAFRARLALEPVVLAPHGVDGVEAPASQTSVSATMRGSRSWFLPVAAAAGFVAIAGALTLSSTSFAPGEPAPTASIARSASPAPLLVATAPASVSASSGAGSVTSGSELQTVVATGQFIRDARLDRYLAAHKQFAGSSALGVPSAYLRNATAEMAGR